MYYVQYIENKLGSDLYQIVTFSKTIWFISWDSRVGYGTEISVGEELALVYAAFA